MLLLPLQFFNLLIDLIRMKDIDITNQDGFYQFKFDHVQKLPKLAFTINDKDFDLLP